MKNTLRLAIISFSAICLLLSCEKSMTSHIVDKEGYSLETKASGERLYNWICPKCHMVNGGWNETCYRCKTKYSPSCSDLIIAYWDKVKTVIKTLTVPPEWYGDEEPAPGAIQLENSIFTAVAPTPWYESPAALKYYNQYMNSILLTDEYKEAFNYAWYKTTHILYPGVHQSFVVESEYDKWVLRESGNLRDMKGKGIKDGAKAAVQAFSHR